MDMEPDVEIETLHASLQFLVERDNDQPAMVVLAPDQGESILGNRGGFLHLAMAALKAAQGEEQVFGKMKWVYNEDSDWQIHSLKPDPLAHIYIPSQRSHLREITGKMFGLLFLAVILIITAAGFYTIGKWIVHFFHV